MKMSARRSLQQSLCLLGIVACTAMWGQAAASGDPASCRIRRVTSLPGSQEFAADFIETMASDPSGKNRNAVWGVTADLSSEVPARQRAIYLSKSTDGGERWVVVARLSDKYFDAEISEGLRNGLAVSPGGRDFVITTQLGAFQIFPRRASEDALVKPIAGPRVPHERPAVIIPKNEGDPVRAGVVLMTEDGRHLIVAYGYFDLQPQLWTYRRDSRGGWVQDGKLSNFPTDLDIFSMQFDEPKKAHPGSLYVGTGDQAYRLDLRTKRWTLIQGVGDDSAIHSMSTVAGLHLAACWGVYNPVSKDVVTPVTDATFLLHPGKDEAGSTIRAYGIEVDPARPNREIVTAITGVYKSADSGETWKRLNDLPEGEFRTAHFNADGSILVSGVGGTFLADPFSQACAPRLRVREK